MKKIYITSLIVILLAVAVGVYFYSKNKRILNHQVDSVASEDEVISSFLLKQTKQNSTPFENLGGKFFCSSKKLWEKEISETQKVVFSATGCSEVILKNGDLRSGSGGEAISLFLLERSGNSWRVADYDEREFPGQKSTKEWVNKYKSAMPQSIQYDNFFSGELGIIEKAAEYYGVSLPEHDFNKCSSSGDCHNSEICFKPEVKFPNANTCLQTCSSNKECGIGYDCRGECVNGTNGACSEIKYACVPDLLYVDLHKDPNGVI